MVKVMSYRVKASRGVFGGPLIALLLSVQGTIGQVPEVGDLAPDFTLQQLEGDYVSLNDFRGKVVLINFFGFI